MMNKLAIIIVGSHGSGKSYLINNNIKKKLNMNIKDRYCRDDNGQIDHRGLIKSQTLQEAKRPISDLDILKNLNILLIPSWPDGLGSPLLSEIETKLKTLGFDIKIHELNNNTEQISTDVVKLIKGILNI
jgi:hypothetical protein